MFDELDGSAAKCTAVEIIQLLKSNNLISNSNSQTE